jgi:hypothetical protein
MCFDQFVIGRNSTPISFCMDRLGPPLTASVLTSSGTGLSVQGDSCASADPLDFARCPEGTHCAFSDPLGVCLYGCAPGDADDCAVVSPTAVCVQPSADPMIGICGDD